MRWDLKSATSETYELKVQTFENGKPEEFLQTMKYFKTATGSTGTTSATMKLQFLSRMLRGKLLDSLVSLQVKLTVLQI